MKRLLSLLLLALLPACGIVTEWNDQAYTGDHDDTLGVRNAALYSAPAPITETAEAMARDYDEAGPGGSGYYTALSRPTQSNGGAGLWTAQRVAPQPAPAHEAPAKKPRRRK